MGVSALWRPPDPSVQPCLLSGGKASRAQEGRKGGGKSSAQRVAQRVAAEDKPAEAVPGSDRAP